MLRMFGLGEGGKFELGWGQETTSDADAANVSIYAVTMGLSLNRIYASGRIFYFLIFVHFPLSGMAYDN